MKKITFCCALFLLCYLNLYPQLTLDDIQIDSTLHETEHPVLLGSIDTTARWIYGYSGEAKSYTNYIYATKAHGGTNWNTSFQTILTYNENDQNLTEETQTWNGSTFDAYSRLEFTYDENMNNDTIYSTTYSGMWNPSSLEVMAYDMGNNLVERRVDYWDIINSEYYHFHREDLTYDSGLRTGYELFEHDGVNWNPLQRATFMFDAQGREESGHYENYSGGLWGDSQQYFNTYNGDDIELILYQVPDGLGWINQQQLDYIYDSNGLSYKVESYQWRDSGGMFEWELIWRITSFYTVLLKANENQISKTKIFPNPFTYYFTIKLGEELLENGELRLLDITGKQVSKSVLVSGVKKITISNSNLDSGVYFVQIKSGQLIETFKIIKQ